MALRHAYHFRVFRSSSIDLIERQIRNNAFELFVFLSKLLKFKHLVRFKACILPPCVKCALCNHHFRDTSAMLPPASCCLIVDTICSTEKRFDFMISTSYGIYHVQIYRGCGSLYWGLVINWRQLRSQKLNVNRVATSLQLATCSRLIQK